MKKYNFSNAIIYCLYKYYKKDLFQARIAFCIYTFLFLGPLMFLLDKLMNFGIFNSVSKLNYFEFFIFISIPLFIIVRWLTLKNDEIEKITEEEGEKLRKRGKKYILLLLFISVVMITIRIIIFKVSRT